MTAPWSRTISRHRPTAPPTEKGSAPMNVLVVGGDGYLGWPTALRLSARGHEVGIVDNLVRRQYDEEMGVDSLVPLRDLETRVRSWRRLSGLRVRTYLGDCAHSDFVT